MKDLIGSGLSCRKVSWDGETDGIVQVCRMSASPRCTLEEVRGVLPTRTLRHVRKGRARHAGVVEDIPRHFLNLSDLRLDRRFCTFEGAVGSGEMIHQALEMQTKEASICERNGFLLLPQQATPRKTVFTLAQYCSKFNSCSILHHPARAGLRSKTHDLPISFSRIRRKVLNAFRSASRKSLPSNFTQRRTLSCHSPNSLSVSPCNFLAHSTVKTLLALPTRPSTSSSFFVL